MTEATNIWQAGIGKVRAAGEPVTVEIAVKTANDLYMYARGLEEDMRRRSLTYEEAERS